MNVYKNVADLMQRYEKCKVFTFEGNVYKYMSCCHVDHYTIKRYRCNEEQHEVLLFIDGGKVKHVKAYYQVIKTREVNV